MTKEFNLGDKATVTGNDLHHYFEIGEEVEVTKLEEDGVVDALGKSGLFFVKTDNLKKKEDE